MSPALVSCLLYSSSRRGQSWLIEVDPDPVGLPTVGYGHKCQQSGCSEVPYPFPLNEDTGTKLLQDDVKVSSPVLLIRALGGGG